MAEKANPIIDELNKILLNTLDYQEVLAKLSRSVPHEATRDRLREFVEVKEKESQNLMNSIKQSGGHIDTNERMTDQEAVYWVPRPLPEANDMKAVLAKLIDTEQNVIDAYENLLGQEKIEKEYGDILKKHRQEAEANLEYFQGAEQSLKKNPT